MTAKELYYFNSHFNRLIARNERLSKLSYASYSNTSAMFEEYYSFVLYGKDLVKYELIRKYEDQVSSQLLFEKKRLTEKGKEQGKDLIKNLIYSPNPLLKMIPKENDWVGRACQFPLPTGVASNA